MHYACSMALRSKCLKRQVGAVIVKEMKSPEDKRIASKSSKRKKGNDDNKASYVISTGCNNVPLNELACKRICYRDARKQEFYNDFHYCRLCGDRLDSSQICPKKHDNKKLPGKLLDLVGECMLKKQLSYKQQD